MHTIIPFPFTNLNLNALPTRGLDPESVPHAQFGRRLGARAGSRGTGAQGSQQAPGPEHRGWPGPPSSAPARILAGSDPACGDPPGSAAPQLRAAARPSGAPKLPGGSLPLRRLQLRPQRTCPGSLSPRGRGGDNTVSGASPKGTTCRRRDAPRSRVVPKPTP